MQGYKITDNQRTRRFGVAANSLKMLKEKAKQKFPIEDCHIYLSKDGFEVSDEDYFKTITPQTLFIVGGPDEEILTDSDFEFNNIKNRSPLLQIGDLISEFIEKHPEKFKQLLLKYESRLKIADDRTHLSHRSEHEDWFQGQDVHCNTKEEILAKKAQDRLRGYYYKTKDEITKQKLYRTNQKAKEMFDRILEKFRYLLIGCNYFSVLFDRNYERKHQFLEDQIDSGIIPNKKLRKLIKEYTEESKILNEWIVSLCTDRGDFYCQGSYSAKDNCSNKHMINPYSTRENLILFQIWNLDHQIEITRTIIPSLIENVKSFIENPKQKCRRHNQTVVDVSILEYFLELFSVKNLKLVHIVCHEKVQRTNKSNGRLICEKCDEYAIIKDLNNISCPEEEVDF